MTERFYFLFYKLPYLSIGIPIILISLFLLFFVQGCVKTINTPKDPTTAELAPMYFSDSPNAVTASIEEATYTIGQGAKRTWEVAGGGLRQVGSSTVQGGKLVATGARATVRGIGSGVAFVGRGIGSGLTFMARTTASAIVFVGQLPIKLYGAIADTQVVSAVITPADHQNAVPIIDPNDPELLAALQALPPIAPADQPQPTALAPAEVAWPMHGAVTTYFGEKGRYYRTVHTGIDISDDNPSGVTPIKAFRKGTVIAAGRDGGLGNRVVVDHGSGITSVYAHLSSILVGVGQAVDTSTTLGIQGSTGVSTGPHLHFEIRVNGQATDPRQFIAGMP